MHQERENLDIIFRKRIPEDVLEQIRFYCRGRIQKTPPYEINSFEEYDYYGEANLTGYSGDEIRTRFDQVDTNCRSSSYSIFGLPRDYAKSVLEYKNLEPLCKIDCVLDWNSVTSRLGQDLFVTSWLAWHDFEYHMWEDGAGFQHSFDWPYCIHTDDVRLNKLLEEGLAENHVHLGGSTQSFPLSWAALMNHPKTIYKTVREEQRFRKDLLQGKGDYSEKNEKRWMMRLRYAALIRAELFRRCLGSMDADEELKIFREYDLTKDNFLIINEIERLRMSYGAKVSLFGEYQYKCLDYTMCASLYRVNLKDHNRLLAGERAFLYTCFLKIYKKEFGLFDKSLFYLYLLIKSNFRSELIQANKRNGFYNFLQYQNRKDQFYPYIEYQVESQRLSVCSSIKDNHIVFMEARIMPKGTAGAIARRIVDNDKCIATASKEDMDKMFYVTHFAKNTFTRKEVEGTKDDVLRPRNWKVRNHIYKQAKALYNFRRKYCGVRDSDGSSNLQSRIHGIDACSSEIGCRPETFATEFRFLRNSNNIFDYNRYLRDIQMRKDLGITYHVGEDFLDICDGLRAVDEAIEFLELQNGDRIGHGLVLGMDPWKYYKDRKYNIFLTKQDYLDNCIWILFRTLEWGIPLNSANREYLRRIACNLADEVYGKINTGKNTGSLEVLYYSWQLRGDHPNLYRSGTYCEDNENSFYSYKKYCKCDKRKDVYRKDACIADLYYRYHFDKNVKLNGLDVVSIPIRSWYIELMENMQEYMRRNCIADKGIAVECNPTSNRLIGYFDNYDQHPILKFNDYMLNPGSKHQQIIVTVNTDDLGVFDTSLNYEYALLLSAIKRKRHNDGNYNDEQVYDYLKYIIGNGFKIAFL